MLPQYQNMGPQRQYASPQHQSMGPPQQTMIGYPPPSMAPPPPATHIRAPPPPAPAPPNMGLPPPPPQTMGLPIQNLPPPPIPQHLVKAQSSSSMFAAGEGIPLRLRTSTWKSKIEGLMEDDENQHNYDGRVSVRLDPLTSYLIRPDILQIETPNRRGR
jgi:hypothetical protein